MNPRMRMSLVALVWLGGVVSGCGSRRSFGFTVVFGDEAARQAVSSLALFVIESSGVSCAALLDGSADPRALPGSTLTQVPYPLTGSLAIRNVPRNKAVFFVEASQADGKALLRGCQSAASAARDLDVTVELGWIAGREQGSGEQGVAVPQEVQSQGEPAVSSPDDALALPDDCPQDPGKTAAGVCGCGVADLDSDADGIADCVDVCLGVNIFGDEDQDGVCGCEEFSAFSDTFEDGVRGGGWSLAWTYEATLGEADGVGQIALQPGLDYSGAGFYSAQPFALEGESVWLEISRMVPLHPDAEAWFSLEIDGKNRIEIVQWNGALYFQKLVQGTQTVVAQKPYAPLTHRFLRLRKSGTTVTFETSKDGTDWTAEASTDFPLDGFYVHIGADSWNFLANPGEFHVAGFNVGQGPGGNGTIIPCSATLSGTRMCATAKEGETLVLSCPGGLVIGEIAFASYGTPTGTCGSFALSTCQASSSLTVVSDACLGQTACAIPATNAIFADPCSATGKRLVVQASCAR